MPFIMTRDGKENCHPDYVICENDVLFINVEEIEEGEEHIMYCNLSHKHTGYAILKGLQYTEEARPKFLHIVEECTRIFPEFKDLNSYAESSILNIQEDFRTRFKEFLRLVINTVHVKDIDRYMAVIDSQ